MKVLIVFNHPAPYKVRAFNELSKFVQLDVIFEREKAGDRPLAFYNCNEYKFNAMFYKNGYIGNEGTCTKKVKQFIAKNYKNYDFIIMNGYSHLSEMMSINYMHRHKIPFGLMINGGLRKNESCLKKMIKKSYIKKASFYLSPCNKANEYLIYYGAKKDKIFLYPYSTFYETDILKKPLTQDEKQTIRSKFHLPNGKLFICPTQFIKRKNNIQLIEQFRDKKDSLLLVGSGKEENKYSKMIAKNNLSNIYILNFVKKDELFDLMKSCDAFITLSKYDIYGQTTLEAFACGLPVISSDNVVSSLQYVENNKNGFIVNLKEPKTISDAIDKINYGMSQNAISTAHKVSLEQEGLKLFEILKGLQK